MAIKTERSSHGFIMTDNEEVGSNANSERNTKLLDLFSSLKNLFTLEYIFGIYRCSIRGEQLLPSTWVNKLYASCLIVGYIIMFMISSDLTEIFEGKGRKIDVIDKIPCIVILVQYVITVIGTTIFFNKANTEMLTTLADLDNKLMSNCENFYRRSSTRTNKFLFLLIVTHVAISILDIATDDAVDWREFVFLPLFLVQKFEIIVFCFIVEMMRSRLAIINIYLSKFLEEKDDVISVFTMSENEGHVI